MLFYPARYGTPQPMMTIDQIKALADWKMMAPEMQRRVELLIVAGHGKIGFGSGGRSAAEQRALFLSRHHEVPCSMPGAMPCLGKCWALNAGAASAACPGSSYHEVVTEAGGALAADMVGDLALMHSIEASYGLHSFENVNGEGWHVQPVEIPNARSDYHLPEYTPGPLPVWGQNPHPDPEDPPDMKIGIYITNDGNGTVLKGYCTPLGSALIVAWVRTAEELAILRANPDHVEFTQYGKGNFKACTLLGPVPPGWSTEFAAIVS